MRNSQIMAKTSDVRKNIPLICRLMLVQPSETDIVSDVTNTYTEYNRLRNAPEIASPETALRGSEDALNKISMPRPKRSEVLLLGIEVKADRVWWPE